MLQSRTLPLRSLLNLLTTGEGKAISPKLNRFLFPFLLNGLLGLAALGQITAPSSAPSQLPSSPAQTPGTNPSRQPTTGNPSTLPGTVPGTRQQPTTQPTNRPSATQQPTGTNPNPTTSGLQRPRPDRPTKGTNSSQATEQDPNEATAQDQLAQQAEDTSGKTPEELERERIRRRVFGYSIFNGKNQSFQPNPRLSAPPNYIIGPEDVLSILMYGYSEMNQVFPVSLQGNIVIPLVGAVQVSGLTLTQAEDRIRSRMSTRYAGLKTSQWGPQNTYLRVTVDQVRTIRVNLVGEVANPGSYNLTSLTTVFNALYNSGGPTEIGSFRTIQVLRKDKVIRTIDLYPYLLTAQKKDDIALQDEDVIFVPAYKTRVEINGEVKKPGLFEVLPGESLAKILEYTGGFNEVALRSRVSLIRLTDRDRRLIGVDASQYETFDMKDADIIAVDRIVDRYNNVVFISGAVYRPGQYPIEENPTLKKLIERAEGLTPDAFTGRVRLVRRKADLTNDLLTFDLSKVVNGELPDVALQREDAVEILSVSDLRQGRNVRIQGNVLNPQMDENEGYFEWFEGMTIEDLVIAAGGLNEAASTYNVEVLRPVRKNDTLSRSVDSEVARVFQVSISRDLKKTPAASSFKLEAYDQVYVRTVLNFQEPQFVQVEGQVLTPGPYGITSRDERVTDVIKRAGGLNQFAYVEGATLVRRIQLSEAEIRQRQTTLLEIADDATNSAVQVEPLAPDRQERISIDLKRVLANPHTDDDLIVEDGDIIRIPKLLQTVRVGGEVQFPTTTRFEKGLSFTDYVSRGGGFTSKSRKRLSYVLYANGEVKRTKKFLFFNSYPRVEPGSEVVVAIKTKSDVTPQLILNALGQSLTAITALTGIILGIQSLSR